MSNADLAPIAVESLPATNRPDPFLSGGSGPGLRPEEPALNCGGRLTAALATARDQCPPAELDRFHELYKRSYASANAKLAAAKAAVAGTGLALLPLEQDWAVIGDGPNACHALRCRFLLVHTSGEAAPLKLTWPILPQRGRPLNDAFKVALTESRAYLWAGLLQMPNATDEGEDSEGPVATTHPPDRNAPPLPAPNPPPVPLPEQAAARTPPEVMDRIDTLLGQLGVNTPERLQQAEAALRRKYPGALGYHALTPEQARETEARLEASFRTRQERP